jgi:hypothetical protein
MRFKHWLEAIQTAPFVVTVRYSTPQYHLPDPEDALDDGRGSNAPYHVGQKYKREEYPNFEDAAAAFKYYIGKAAQMQSVIQSNSAYVDHVSLTQFAQGGFAPKPIDLAWWNIGRRVEFGPSLKDKPEIRDALKSPMDHVDMFNKFKQPLQPGELGPTDKTVKFKIPQKDLERESPTKIT